MADAKTSLKDLSAPNPLLRCTECREMGKVRAQGDGYVVTCRREGVFCCQTTKCATPQEAIDRWRKHHG